MKIAYHEKELNLKCEMREFLIFEKLNNGHIFTGEDAEDFAKLFYASIISALGYQPPLDDFLEYLEKNEDAFVEFINENFKDD